MRLTAAQILHLSPLATQQIYLRLEAEACGRSQILVTPDVLQYSRNQRHRAFKLLRDYGFAINWSRSDNAYRVIFPDPQVDIEEMLRELNTMDAAKTYTITRDMLTALRKTYQEMPAADFCAALRNSLISAQSAQIKPRALQSWLHKGIKHARDNNNAAAANKSQTEKQNKETQDDDEWHKRLNQTMRDRPDPEKLSMALYGRPNP